VPFSNFAAAPLFLFALKLFQLKQAVLARPSDRYCPCMNSERRIQASCANGALSRGPITVQGKLNSSRNSTRHGVLAQTIVLDSESKTRFEELLVSYTAEFQPRTPAETGLVETMAVARWRHMRGCHIQRAGFDLEMARQESPEDSPPVLAAAAFRNLSDTSRSLDLLLRYETAFERQFTRALNTLLKLQARPNRGEGPTLPPEGVAATWDPKDDPVLPNEPTNPLKTNHAPSEDPSGAGSQPARGSLAPLVGSKKDPALEAAAGRPAQQASTQTNLPHSRSS
jgi:hypothetical protein